MTIKEKLKSMKISKDFPEGRIMNYQNIDFTIFPIDYVSIYSTKSDYQNNKALVRIELLNLDRINQSLLDYNFDYFTLQKSFFESQYDLVFVLKYEYQDNSTINMQIKIIE